MRSQHFLYALTLALGGWTATADAQTGKTQTDPQGQPKETRDTTDADEAHTAFHHRASKVIGAKVKNSKGEDLGKVEELVVDPGEGTIEYAVLSFGGFLGMGDKLFAIPFQLLKARVEGDGSQAHFTFDMDKAKLEQAPGFPKNNWPDIHTSEWRSAIDKFFGVGQRDPSRAVEENEKLRLCKASEIMGKDIDGPGDEDVGKIKELVIDPRAARVSYFVLSSGGFLGMGDKLVAVPWEAISVRQDGDKDKYVVRLTKEQLQKAPEFKDADWKRMSDPDWVEDLYEYYDMRPYWTAEAGYSRERD
jgi:sporulation protein YlmC with PRC-barrel domain